MEGHVFVSYVNQDSSLVDDLCEALQENGVRVWRDRDQLDPGEFWQNSIRRAISEGVYFVACFSDAYFQRSRTYMNTEVGLAIEELASRPRNSKWFIPVLLSDCSIPEIPIGGLGTLRDIHAVSLHSDWSTGINRLLRVLAPDRRIGVDKGEVAPRILKLDKKRIDPQRRPKLKDLKSEGDFDPGWELLAPEERYLLGMSARSGGVTMAKACATIALEPERHKSCLDRLTEEELLTVEELDGETTWRLSEIGKSFLKNNYWARLV